MSREADAGRIVVREASENNLKSVDVDIPHGRLTVITGVSGSGKSSLAFDVIYQEARRRYLESFSAHARQLMGKLRRPDVGRLTGLSPALALGRPSAAAGPRSTVGTLTGITDLLRLLYARLGDAPPGVRPARRLFSFNSPHGACPACRGLGVEDRIDPDLLVADPAKSLRQGALAITTPSGYVIYSQVTMDVLDRVCRAHGFSADVPWKDLTDAQKDVVLNGSDRIRIPYGKHPLESRMRWKGITPRPRQEGVYKGILPVMDATLAGKRNKNILRFARTLPCRSCGGRRLRPEALAVTFRGRSIADLAGLTLAGLDAFFRDLALSGAEQPAGEPIRAAVRKRTDILLRLGLDHLALDRATDSLSGGDARRLRLAAQATGGLRGVTYILDEPTMGLHPADTEKLLGVLRELRDAGNTIIVVEHDETVMRAADHLIDLGPGAGEQGGRIIFSGPPSDLAGLPAGASATRDFLLGDRRNPAPPRDARRDGRGSITVLGARLHNLQAIDAVFRLGAFNVVTGVSGSGKATLVHEILARRLRDGAFGPGPDADGLRIEGKTGKIIEIDQAPIGRTPRSNPATYTGLSDRIRDLFADLPEARERGWGKGRFSFNVAGGRCETCEGAGLIRIGMHFLGDVDVECPACEGRRFNDETLSVRYRGRSVSEVLAMSVDETAALFADRPPMARILEALARLGLGYLKLGQSSATLSGGEAQRVKLAGELARPSAGGAIYILEEPTTGLHPHDVGVLVASLQALVDKGRTIVAIEHNADVIKAADFVIDLGPGSGERGGTIVAQGRPEDVAAVEASLTGRVLRQALADEPPAPIAKAAPPPAPAGGEPPIALTGVSTHNLRGIDVRIPYRSLTIVTGPSGSGKSSLAFDTLFAEARQRYIESFSAYVRTLIAKGERAELAAAEGLTPPIAVSRAAAGHHPRSTVGTVTEIQDFYRLLFARAGTGGDAPGRPPLTASRFSFNHEQGACPRCKGLGSLTACDPEKLVTHPERSLFGGALDGTKTGRYYGEPHGQFLAALKAAAQAAGIDLDRPYGELGEAERQLALDGSGDRAYDVAWSYVRGSREGVHRFRGPWKGFAALVDEEYERKHADHRGEAMRALMSERPCPACGGRRLRPESLAVRVLGRTIADLSALTVRDAIRFFRDEAPAAKEPERACAVLAAIGAEVLPRLELIRDAGLGYLALDRPSSTLSGGEAQRLRLAGQLGARLTGVTYVLDEPTAGLHPRDTERLVSLLRDLTRHGNTVVAVEHDPDVIAAADHVIDLGPGAGRLGGAVVAEGPPRVVAAADTATGRLLAGKMDDPEPLPFLPGPGVRIRGARAHNLLAIDAEFIGGGLTAVTGVSGSGKSSLVFDVLLASARAGKPVACAGVEGLDRFAGVVAVDAAPPGAGPLSTPATYLGLFDAVRTVFAASDEARRRGFGRSHFSYLTAAGRCPTCGGTGVTRISMDMMADVLTPCEECGGRRYRPEVLEVAVRGCSIADVLEMTAAEAGAFFAEPHALRAALAALDEIGLGYVRLGQPLDTLSGGEAQRLKLAAGLLKPAAGPVLYLFDEPTAGLHAVDVDRLAAVFARLLRAGHTLVAVEHDPRLIARAAHLIDLGPGGGDQGGALIASGPPAAVAACPASATGAALRRLRAI